jgi:hypothetical protein
MNTVQIEFFFVNGSSIRFGMNWSRERITLIAVVADAIRIQIGAGL